MVGSPRSGTTFLAGTIGAVPGFVDLSEVNPHKAGIPELAGLSEADAARRIRVVLERVRRLALVTGLRGVEQTPETAFVLAAALRAYPRGRAVHVVRDGRDVVCSLLERGWLSTGKSGGDDAKLAYGARARFWVEPDRIAEFESASDATRAAWAWRSYLETARRRRRHAHARAPLRVDRLRSRPLPPKPSRPISASTRRRSPAASGASTTARSAATAAISPRSSWPTSSAKPVRSSPSSATSRARDSYRSLRSL